MRPIMWAAFLLMGEQNRGTDYWGTFVISFLEGLQNHQKSSRSFFVLPEPSIVGDNVLPEASIVAITSTRCCGHVRLRYFQLQLYSRASVY